MAALGISLRLATLVAGGSGPDPATRPDPSPPDDPLPDPDPDPDPGTTPDWPQDAVALWLILGQSNAEGFAPERQDPARENPANAVSALTVEERDVHPWVRFSTRGLVPETMGRFPTEGQGIATGLTQTSSHSWNGPDSLALGIPAGTRTFGPEIALVRHVLDGDAPAGWRDAVDPKLYVFKQAEGSRAVDHFRWGGAGQDRVLQSLRQDAGQNLTSLAASKTVLLQGVIFVIGERDALHEAPTGGTMAQTLEPRFREWVRQVRGALGQDVPVAFCEVYDAVDARREVSNAQMATLAASLPNAAVIARTPEWTEIGDDTHYDAQGQDRLGRAAFGHFRDVYGRAGDGLVTGFEFTGLNPWFHVPPVFIDDLGGQMRIAATPSETGVVLAKVVPVGAPMSSAEEIAAAVDASEEKTFKRDVVADQERLWFSGNPTAFELGETTDVHFVLRNEAGVLGEVYKATRAGGVVFAPKLAIDGSSVAADAASATLQPKFDGVVSWALHEGSRRYMRGEDVEAMAFLPVAAGVETAILNSPLTIPLSGLTSGTTYTLFATGRRASDGLMGVTYRVEFTTA
ncbi:MAG: sialate O-acetylesterase [Pseudomonadota bacterium]